MSYLTSQKSACPNCKCATTNVYRVDQTLKASSSLYLCTFAIPLSLLSYLYATIGLKLWRRRIPGNVDVNRDLSAQAKRVKVGSGLTYFFHESSLTKTNFLH